MTYIPPKAAKPEALRVAAYCRVSSDSSAFAPSRVFTSQSLQAYKPKREFYTAILKKLALRPEETLFVGDSLKNDVQGPQSVGMRACWVNRKEGHPGDVVPDYQVAVSYTHLDVYKRQILLLTNGGQAVIIIP